MRKVRKYTEYIALFPINMFKESNVTCPICKSNEVLVISNGRSTGSLIGGVAGIIGGVGRVKSASIGGAMLGASIGRIGGPLGITLGGIAGTIFGALIGATTGSISGAKIGAILDRIVLNNRQCLCCGHRFAERHVGEGA